MSPRHLQDVFKTFLQDAFKTCLQDVFKTSSRRLQRSNFLSSKMSWRRFARCLQDVLEDEKLLRWRCVEDVFKTCLQDVFRLQDALKTNKCLLGYFIHFCCLFWKPSETFSVSLVYYLVYWHFSFTVMEPFVFFFTWLTLSLSLEIKIFVNVWFCVTTKLKLFNRCVMI